MKTWTELHRAGIECDRLRLAMHQADVRLQEDCNAETDAAYYDAVATLVAAEADYARIEARLEP